jgi:pimeloyl-ACP methyl ester carboxylesterase
VATFTKEGSMDAIGPVRREVTVHGHRRAFIDFGPAEAPTLLLIHGIGDSSDTWREIIPSLAHRYRVIAPDLLGHGASAKPRADYSVGGYANGMRDLLSVLEVESASVIGHSLGGGVAMQFAYQYPERCERLVLISTGGVGREVHPVLKLMSLTRTDAALRLLRLPGSRLLGEAWALSARWSGTKIGRDAGDLLRIFESMPDGASRDAVLRTLRAAIDHRGQLFTMLDRCYLAEGMPTMIMWGAQDAIVPVKHASIAHQAMPGSRLEIFESSGHFPHHTETERFLEILEAFLESPGHAVRRSEEWRELLRSGS